MKTMAKVVLGAAVCVLAAVSAAVAAPASGNGRPVGSQGGQELRRSHLKWWQEARFGMFVHLTSPTATPRYSSSGDILVGVCDP